MKNIFYYGVDNNKGGLENFAKNLITEILNQTSEFKFHILTCYNDVAFKEHFEKIGCEIIILPSWRKHPLKFYKQFLTVLKSKSINNDVIHLNICSYRNFFLFKACKKSKLKTIIVGHYTKATSVLSSIIHKINKLIFRNFGIKVTNSDDVTKYMFRKKDNPIFIFNGIDTNKFEYNENYRIEIRNKYNIPKEQIVIGQIGRISPDKNQIFSIKLSNQLHKINPNYHLYLIGNELYDEPRKLVDEFKCNDFVHFLGSQDHIEKYYSAFDISLLPSINEGLSLALLENACNGINVFLSTAVPSLKVKSNSIKYLDLNTNLWEKEIIKTKVIERNNVLKKSVYDISICAQNYIKIYLS